MNDISHVIMFILLQIIISEEDEIKKTSAGDSPFAKKNTITSSDPQRSA